MSPLFKKRGAQGGKERTVLVLDVENDSVASALVRLSPHEPPKLFGEKRVKIPMQSTLSSDVLLRKLEWSAEEALAYTSATAAHIRAHEQLHPLGMISEGAIFLSAPWSSFVQSKGAYRWRHDPEVAHMLRDLLDSTTSVRTTLHPFAAPALYAAGALNQSEHALVCIITGEVAEILYTQNDALQGRATIPMGSHTLLRTLQTHAGLSEHEARSSLHLMREAGAENFLAEPLFAASSHFTSELQDVAKELFRPGTVGSVAVIAPEPMGEWFARAISSAPDLTALFPQDATVRAIHSRHLMPYIAAHAATPDLTLMLEALYMHSLLEA